MLNKRALAAIKKKLPKDGFQLVSDKSGVSKESVKKILNDPLRFNKDVIAAALTVIEEYQEELAQLETRAKNLTAKS